MRPDEGSTQGAQPTTNGASGAQRAKPRQELEMLKLPRDRSAVKVRGSQPENAGAPGLRAAGRPPRHEEVPKEPRP